MKLQKDLSKLFFEAFKEDQKIAEKIYDVIVSSNLKLDFFQDSNDIYYDDYLCIACRMKESGLKYDISHVKNLFRFFKEKNIIIEKIRMQNILDFFNNDYYFDLVVYICELFDIKLKLDPGDKIEKWCGTRCLKIFSYIVDKMNRRNYDISRCLIRNENTEGLKIYLDKFKEEITVTDFHNACKTNNIELVECICKYCPSFSYSKEEVKVLQKIIPLVKKISRVIIYKNHSTKLK